MNFPRGSRDANVGGGPQGWAVLRLLILGLMLALVGGAAGQLDKLQSEAQARYGQRGATIMAEWAKMLAENKGQDDESLLKVVNEFVNRRVLYGEDAVIWQQPDYWATPLETLGRGVGDCEDFSIAKYVALLQLGVSNDKLRLIYVRAKSGVGGASVAHMVLGYFATPEDEPLILDNLITSVRTASSRKDLQPVFSFNTNGLWAGGQSGGDPTARLSQWRSVLERMRQEGWTLPTPKS
ncbi:MAG: transglutaminase-like cysteine peptidase [Rhodoferax sp.]